MDNICDDQYSIDEIDENDDQLDLPFHEQVTPELVKKALKISYDNHFTFEGNYDILVKLLEPQTEDEKRIIRDTIRDYSLPDYC